MLGIGLGLSLENIVKILKISELENIGYISPIYITDIYRANPDIHAVFSVRLCNINFYKCHREYWLACRIFIFFFYLVLGFCTLTVHS